MCTYVYMCVNVYVGLCKYTQMSCFQKYKYAYLNRKFFIYMYTHAYTLTDICTHVRTHTHTHSLTHTHTHAHTHTHIHTHTFDAKLNFTFH